MNVPASRSTVLATCSGVAALLLLMMPVSQQAQVRSSSTPKEPAPGELLVTSTPSGLSVAIEKHKTPPKMNLLRYSAAEEKPRGETPLLVALEPGDYTVAVGREFAAGSPEMKEVPRGRARGFGVSGSTIFFETFKCNMYPDEKFLDPLDPYERDGNVGVCFDAPPEPGAPIRYFRLYAVTKTDAAAKVNVAFRLRKK
jgi:hypothetical protein